MGPAVLKAALATSLDRVTGAIEAVLQRDPQAIVPWTGRRMAVASFVTHLRSELALHRWDLVGDDGDGFRLLGQPELTEHAVASLGRVLVSRSPRPSSNNRRIALHSPDTPDVVVVVDQEGARLEHGTGTEDPALVADPAARLLVLWGRQPADPRRVRVPAGPDLLAELRTLLAGY
jgi:hypothetical protein